MDRYAARNENFVPRCDEVEDSRIAVLARGARQKNRATSQGRPNNRISRAALGWFALDEGDYVRLEPDGAGVIRSRIFPGLCLAIRALIEGDMPTVLAVQQRE